jgi:putative transposase
MPNHTHLIAVPASEQALRRAIGEAHRRYTRRINFREKWRGYLWQGRFASFVMDEPYLLAAARYVELNPLRARLVDSPVEWPWSSARAHLSGRDDCLAKVAPLLAMVGDWQGLLNTALPEEELEAFRRHGRTGRPLGDETFLERLESLVGRVLKVQKGGRPKKQRNQ